MLTKDIYGACTECLPIVGKIISVVFEGRCTKIDTPNCDINWAQSRTPACRKCSAGYYTHESGLCLNTCDTANGMGIMDKMYVDGALYCARCPENCKTCQFDADLLDFKCLTCSDDIQYEIRNNLC
jgi:hypothetical protein